MLAYSVKVHWYSSCSRKKRSTYLLSSVTFDREYFALQIINQFGSIIIEAGKKDGVACTAVLY